MFSTLCHDPLMVMDSETARKICEEFIHEKFPYPFKWRDARNALESLDYLFSQNENFFLHPYQGDDGSEFFRKALSVTETSSGDYLIQGDYSSPNTETWNHPERMKFILFDEANDIILKQPNDASEHNSVNPTI